MKRWRLFIYQVRVSRQLRRHLKRNPPEPMPWPTTEERRYNIFRQPFLIALDRGTLTAEHVAAVPPEILERIMAEECDRWPRFLAGERLA